MDPIVLCEPVRTPIGRYGGVFRTQSAAELAAVAIGAVVERSGIDPTVIDDVTLGHCNASSDAPALGRVAALDAGLPVTVSGAHIDRRCGSGLHAIITSGLEVRSAMADVAIAGGSESMSRAPHYTHQARWGSPGGDLRLIDSLLQARRLAGGRHHVIEGGMIETAENLRRAFDISRRDQDAFAVASHAKAVAAQASGRFQAEIVPVTVESRRGSTTVTEDEHPRPDVTLESLAALRPLLAGQDPEATVTAGNASGQNDGAAACLVTTADRAEELGVEPYVRLVSWARSGVDPARMGIGPVDATARALDHAGIGLDDIDLIELNEAFAAQALAVLAEWRISADDDRLNVNGSGISLGHPVGATGARMVTTIAHELRARQGRYGLVTLCIGGGQGLAAVVERAG